MALIAAFLSIAGLLPVSGKVFRLFGTGGRDVFNNGSLPWEHAYQTRMTVNGKPSTVHMYSARYSEPVVEQLKQRFAELGATVQVARSEEGATGVARWPDQTASFIVLAQPGEPSQQIFIYQPEPGAVAKPATLPVPDNPRSRVLTTVSDDDTGTFLATLETSASATETHAFYARALPGAGWQLVAPALVKDGTISGMAVYQRKKQICYVQATDRMDGLNMITLLVKAGTL